MFRFKKNFLQSKNPIFIENPIFYSTQPSSMLKKINELSNPLGIPRSFVYFKVKLEKTFSAKRHFSLFWPKMENFLNFEIFKIFDSYSKTKFFLNLGSPGSNLPTPAATSASKNPHNFLSDFSSTPEWAKNPQKSDTNFVVFGELRRSKISGKDSHSKSNPKENAKKEAMCGIVPNAICRFSELAPGQFGLTKQLVFV